MAKIGLTDAEVEREIERLRGSELVRLAQKEESIRYARRNYLYRLRGLERRGAELAEAGVTMGDLVLKEMEADT